MYLCVDIWYIMVISTHELVMGLNENPNFRSYNLVCMYNSQQRRKNLFSRLPFWVRAGGSWAVCLVGAFHMEWGLLTGRNRNRAAERELLGEPTPNTPFQRSEKIIFRDQQLLCSPTIQAFLYPCNMQNTLSPPKAWQTVQSAVQYRIILSASSQTFSFSLLH